MFVWKIPDIKELPELSIIPAKPREYAVEYTDNYSIAIIGLGPKGLYSLAALQEQLTAKNVSARISIHLFNAHPCLAAGPNYDISQPEYLLINYSIEKISAWKSSELDGREKLTFIDWIEKHRTRSQPPKKGDFASRALVGMYLRDALNVILKRLPKQVEVKAYLAEVVDCIPTSDGKFRVDLNREPTNILMNYDQLMITTGHSFKPRALVNQAVPGRLIESVYPVESKLGEIKNHHSVGIAGLGLTFVDTLLALTEGRGGKFQQVTGALQYVPSGAEPRAIYAFSRSGLPMIPRNGSDSDRYSTSAHVLDLLNIVARKKGSIDFRADLLPIIKLEMENAWYQGIVASKGRGENWYKTFNFSELMSPFKDLNFNSSSEYEGAFTKLLASYLGEMGASPETSPLQLVSSVWRNLLPKITEIYNFGGFKADSLVDFQDNFLGRFNQISFGPPVLSIKKVACLLKHGLLQVVKLDQAGITAKPDGSFVIHTLDGDVKKVDYLLQASIAKNNFPAATNPLFRRLHEVGLATPFEKDSKVFSWPALSEEGHLVSQNGVITANITLYGTPTEGMTLDNDSLSRNINDFASPWAKKITTALNQPQAFKKYENRSANSTSTHPNSDYKTMDLSTSH
ncbi:FAD/NAD(P)-binding protein [Algoriphagus sp.]|uniref:FAD/NAD(P)-binding protein n=1 Tax=Algoriphagus sp. TaxID=1872435 RepID=UPI00326C116D